MQTVQTMQTHMPASIMSDLMNVKMLHSKIRNPYFIDRLSNKNSMLIWTRNHGIY